MNLKNCGGSLVLILSIIFITNGLFSAAKPTAVVVEVKGKVEVSYIAGVWVPAKVGTKLYEKDMIRTKKGSQSRIKFSDGTFTSMKENSTVRLAEFKSEIQVKKTMFKKTQVPVKKIKLKMLKGNIFSKVKRLSEASKFNVATPMAVCGVRGTSFGIKHRDESEVKVLEGEVDVFNPDFPDAIVRVSKGRKTSIRAKSKPAKPKKLSASELKELQQEEKVITKEVVLELEPEFIDQDYTVVQESDKGKTIEYSVKIKNILADKTTVYLVLFNEKGEEYKSVPMKFVAGGKDIKDIKTFKVKYVFSESGKFSHRYKLLAK